MNVTHRRKPPGFAGTVLMAIRQAQAELVLSFERPATAPGTCQNCGEPIGSSHKRECPIIGGVVIKADTEGDRQIHLICQPEGDVIQAPDGTAVPRITGMKFQTGTGPLAIMADWTEIAGEAAEAIGKRVVTASHDPDHHIFGLQLEDGYGIVLSAEGGLRVLYTKALAIEFRRPLVVQ